MQKLITSSASLAIALAVSWGCSNGIGGGGGPDAGDNGNGNGNGGGANGNGNGNGNGGDTCFNLECDQVECDGGDTTTVDGVVNIPSGDFPLPGVDVWIPNTEIDPIEHGARCETCDEQVSGNPVVQDSTDVEGRFVLENAPVGEDIPLVIQTGNWRRQLTINVDPCTDNAIADEDRTRLPRNSSEGSIPRIAITTGACDALECLVRKLGVDDSEFSTDDGNGQIHLFQGGINNGSDRGPGRGDFSTDAAFDIPEPGASFTEASQLWSDEDRLNNYDILIDSCECRPNTNNKPDAAQDIVEDYTAEGGRVFLSHWQFVWLDNEHGRWDGAPVDDFTPVGEFQDLGDDDDSIPPDLSEEHTAFIRTDFEGGQELEDWMVEVDASATRGEFDYFEARATVLDVNDDVADEWVYFNNPYDDPVRERTQYMSFDTPVGVDNQCGRVVFSDIHVTAAEAGGDEAGEDHPFPEGCGDQVTAQEKALIYFLFDVAACIERDAPPIE